MRFRENKDSKIAIKRSQINEEAMRLLNQNYNFLYNELVKTDNDRDLFNDTVLSISYKYNPDNEFNEQFIFHFKSNQVGLTQENKIRNYLIQEIPENYDIIEDEPEHNEDKITMNDFINDLTSKTKLTSQDLQERLNWTLNQKIDHALGAIEKFYNSTNGKCYISFSGGKDSTVLLHLARRLYPKIKAMYIQTGNDYPEIVKFVRKTDNVDFIRPKYKLKQIIEKYGFPLISKEQSYYLYQVKRTKSQKLKNIRLNGGNNGKTGKISEKWKPLIKESFNVASQCCDYLKKKPAKKYEKEKGLKPIIGTLATESELRKQSYLKTGCVVLDKGKEICKPLSIWTDKDIWDYIKKYKVDYCELYDKGFSRTGCMVCGFGCQYKDDDRFTTLKKIHPKCYSTFLNYENNGVPFKDAINVIFKINSKPLLK